MTQYHGKRRLDYTRMHQRSGRSVRPFARKSYADFDYGSFLTGTAPPGFVDAIVGWLNENLSQMMLNTMSIRRNGDYLAINKDSNFRDDQSYRGRKSATATVSFGKEKVTISASGWTYEVDYVNPELFEQIQYAVSMFYNGQKP